MENRRIERAQEHATSEEGVVFHRWRVFRDTDILLWIDLYAIKYVDDENDDGGGGPAIGLRRFAIYGQRISLFFRVVDGICGSVYSVI